MDGIFKPNIASITIKAGIQSSQQSPITIIALYEFSNH